MPAQRHGSALLKKVLLEKNEGGLVPTQITYFAFILAVSGSGSGSASVNFWVLGLPDLGSVTRITRSCKYRYTSKRF
jgi:hypothetical protein